MFLKSYLCLKVIIFAIYSCVFYNNVDMPRLRTKQPKKDHKDKKIIAGGGVAGAALGAVASRKERMSPVKLYRHDMKNQRVKRTWGPKGKPAAGCSGSICYRHKNVDWTVHRLAPTLNERGGPRRKKIIQGGIKKLGPSSRIIKGDKKLAKRLDKHLDKLDKKVIASNPTTRRGRLVKKARTKVLHAGDTVHDNIKHGAGSIEFSNEAVKDTSGFLRKTSPRWGEGKVPGRMEGRKVVSTPTGKNLAISKKTYIAAGAIAGAAGATYYVRRRRGKQERVRKAQNVQHQTSVTSVKKKTFGTIGSARGRRNR